MKVQEVGNNKPNKSWHDLKLLQGGKRNNWNIIYQKGNLIPFSFLNYASPPYSILN